MGKGYNKSLFGGVPRKNVNKSRFNLSHEWKAQFNPGLLIPCLLLETLPNDEFEIDSEFLFRFSPLYFPIMHKMTMRADYFYIPNRILWPYVSESNRGWVNWINNEETYEHPTVDAWQGWDNAVLSQQVGTYFGLPTIIEGIVNATDIITDLNAFPFSAYLKIWDWYYRIPQIEEERWFALVPGDNSAAFGTAYSAPVTITKYYEVFSAKWEKDYFTSALPQPQVGDAITIPTLDESLPITQTIRNSSTGAPVTVTGTLQIESGTGKLERDDNLNVYVDQDNPATIKQLRLAEVLQSYYERIMKVGTRYRDFIQGLWGNDPEPNTIDAPVQFGSKFGRVQVSDVMTQASYDYAEGNSRTGDYTGQASMYSNDGGRLHYKCNEHGWIMCILQVNPNTSYGQGIERFWRRSVQTDYPLDMFSSIGDQEILKEEVVWNPIIADAAKNEETFGYIPRFSEMRYKNNLFVGGLAHNTGVSQHLGRLWSTDVYTTAGAYDEFIEIDSDFTDVSPRGSAAFSEDFIGGIRIDDVFRILPNVVGTQFESEASIYAHVYHSIYANRQLPMFSVPDLT